MNFLRSHVPALLPLAVILGATGLVLQRSAEARQVAWETVMLLFTFFTTPFVLETTVAVLGFVAVLAINQRRLDKEQDEWVVMEVPLRPEPADEEPLGR